MKLALTETTTRCICDCPCHGGLQCGDIIEDGDKDCGHDCRGTTSCVVCDPFVERWEEQHATPVDA